ncbi:phosphoribosyltransferase [Nocardia sp. SYP-A9097]|uniref:phosphoribosyltransferase n=1 Tax=Nocardia sp. SYP-A9097 TaxID=2663237 RepID=UPI00129C0C05|nr:phosphoribosyltransferase family protein [Nocardia sp. SYP-A9097]MRH88122.1 phosphoribosyltransferase [Nocardia sp. SYP-A9097]
MPPFQDRNDAGRQLAGLLAAFRGHDVVVLAPPGGGVRVAAELATTLHIALDVILVRPLTVARRPDLVYGLLGEDETLLIDTTAVADGALCESERAETEQRQSEILRRSAFSYRGDRKRVDLRDRTVVITDDCLTDATVLRHSCRMARVHGAIRIAVAVPVAARSALGNLSPYADKIVCPHPTAQPPDADRWYPPGGPTASADIAALLGGNHSCDWSNGFAGPDRRTTPASRSSSMRGRCS